MTSLARVWVTVFACYGMKFTSKIECKHNNNLIVEIRVLNFNTLHLFEWRAFPTILE